MKLFLDTKARRFVKSAASNVALQTLHLKRRDQVPLEIIFVANNAVVTAPTGTTTTVGLKAKFSDANFLAFAPAGTEVLDLYTEPVESAFATNPAAIPALLEVKWSAPGENLRTATLQVELQNSVILGTEGTPTAIPDLKATQAQAEAGTSNETWMTPLRTAQAIAELAPPPTWASVLDKPESFPPSSHTHTASQITDFSSAVVAAAPPTTNASLLTSGTLADARLSATVTASLAKADTASQPGHGHSISDVANLATALAEKATITSVTTVSEALTAESQARAAADTALGQRIDFLAENLDPAALDSISEVVTAFQQADSDLGGTITALASAAQPKNLATAIEVKAVTQGAYSDGTTIPAGTPVEEVLRKMLQTRVPATYAAPTLSISANFGTQAEIGSSYSGTIVPTWQQRDAGAATLTSLALNGAQFASTTGAPASTYSIPSRPLTASESWQLTTSHAAGPQKLDNFGDPSGTPIAAGTISSNTLTITPVRRIFLGASTDTAAPTTSAQIRALATSALNPANGSTYTLTLPVGTRRAVIAYPATLRAISSVKYVELGNAEVRDTFTESTMQVDGATAGQNATAYRVYTYIAAIPLGAAATYTITI